MLENFTVETFADRIAKGIRGAPRDALVADLTPADRRGTLIARREPNTANVYRFDIHMQGDKETVFFDL